MHGWLEAGSQYDAGIISVAKVAFTSPIPNVNILDNLIGWMLANAGEVTLKLNLSQLQYHTDAYHTMLVPASYCEPAFVRVAHWTLLASSYYMWFMSHIELLNNYVNYGIGG